jgi:DNA-binding LacI/PurR family transcriptional regulator
MAIAPCSMSDLAREAGVSKNTVSLALRHDPQIPPATRARIRKLAQKFGYRKNPIVSHLMAELRGGRSQGFQSTLAILNAHTDSQAFRTHPTIPTYVKGCRRRADELGYSLDEFWLHDPELNGTRLNRILRSRGIRAVLVVGLMKENRLPPRFLPTWREFPAIVTGVRTEEPALSFACTDHHMLALRAFECALQRGYRRPALVLDHVIDRLVEGRLTAGAWIAQERLPPGQRIPPFTLVSEARKDPALFHRWLEQQQPDLLLTLYNVVRTWLDDLGLRVPRDIGLIQLEWRSDRPEWAGMNQHNDFVGEAAVDMAIGMIHRGEVGIPSFPRATLIGNTWVNGDTIRCAKVDEHTRRWNRTLNDGIADQGVVHGGDPPHAA